MNRSDATIPPSIPRNSGNDTPGPLQSRGFKSLCEIISSQNKLAATSGTCT